MEGLEARWHSHSRYRARLPCWVWDCSERAVWLGAAGPHADAARMKPRTLGVYDIADLHELARRRLPKGVFEFFDRGNGDETALANNRAAIERVKLSPHMLVDTSGRSLEVTLFGRR